MSDSVSISEFKSKCLALISQVKITGVPLIITKKGKPIAQVVLPPDPPKPNSWLGSMRGTGAIIDDIISPAMEESEWEVLQG